MGQPVVHFEIGGRDIERSEKFFTALFGWSVQRSGPVSLIDTGGDGINGHISAVNRRPYRYVTVYVQVDDLQAYLRKAETLGGKTLVPPMELPTGTFAWFADPDGNPIGLWKPKETPSLA